MKRIVWDFMKVSIIFVGCTCVFYLGLKAMHEEYEQYHRYDQPEGPAVKVFNEDEGFINRIQLFFRLGE